MKIEKEQYWELIKQIDNVPTEQSYWWIDAIYSEIESHLVYYIDSIEKPKISCVGLISKHRFIGKSLHIEGLCSGKQISESDIKSFFSSLINDNYDYISFSDICEYNPIFEVAIRRAGYIRPAGISLCPLTMMVDLQANFSFHRQWKRAVKKSIESGNLFEHIENPNHQSAVVFEELFKGMSARKGLGSYPKAEQVEKLLSKDTPYSLFVIRNNKGEIISSRIEYANQDLVYDVWAANSEEAMKTGAAYHIQEGVFNYYKGKGYSRFDYGRIPPSADYMDNIYIAKSYSGGFPVAYNGQWEFSKSNLVSYLLSFRSFILNRQRRY